MGQQQLLLIILGVIIVGIAVAVGVTMFHDNAVDQNRNAVISDLVTLSARARQYYLKPAYLGGGGRSFVGLTPTTGVGLLATDRFTANANGTYTIKSAGTATEVVIKGVGKQAFGDGTEYPEYEITVTSTGHTIQKIN